MCGGGEEIELVVGAVLELVSSVLPPRHPPPPTEGCACQAEGAAVREWTEK